MDHLSQLRNQELELLTYPCSEAEVTAALEALYAFPAIASDPPEIRFVTSPKAFEQYKTECHEALSVLDLLLLSEILTTAMDAFNLSDYIRNLGSTYECLVDQVYKQIDCELVSSKLSSCHLATDILSFGERLNHYELALQLCRCLVFSLVTSDYIVVSAKPTLLETETQIILSWGDDFDVRVLRDGIPKLEEIHRPYFPNYRPHQPTINFNWRPPSDGWNMY